MNNNVNINDERIQLKEELKDTIRELIYDSLVLTKYNNNRKIFADIIMANMHNPSFLGLDKKNRKNEFKVSNEELKKIIEKLDIEKLYDRLEKTCAEFLNNCTAKII